MLDIARNRVHYKTEAITIDVTARIGSMRILLLLRHAKSSWDDAALQDFDRALAPRGERAAVAVGAEIARRNWQAERTLVSSALRTRQTWQLIAPLLGEARDAEFRDDLYHATSALMLDLIQTTKNDVGSLMIVGHNPGLEELAALLAAENSDAEAMRGMDAKFPTGALARYEIETSWRELGAGTARLTHFIRPRDLER
jgi:phosphohistidine phosphatase